MKLPKISTFLLLLVMSLPAGATQLKLATLAPDGSGWMEQMRAAAGRIAERTDGEVTIRFYPGGVMGDAGTVLRRMRMGQLHGGAFILGDLAEIAPVANLYSMPFVFRDLDEIEAVRGEFDRVILEGLESGGIVAPGISLAGFAYLFSSERLPTRADGIDSSLRVWVPEGDRLSQQTLKQAGASPVPLPLAEVYTALQTGAVNTFASTLSATVIMQWHTRARYMLDLPLLMTVGTIGIDRRTMEELAPAHREIVMRELGDTLAEIEQDNHADNADARAALAGQGIEFIAPDAGAVEHWQRLAERARKRAVADGDDRIPHLDRLLARLESLRERE